VFNVIIRLGVNVGGYEDQGVQNLRSHLFYYSLTNASTPVSVANATALFGLLPLHFRCSKF